MSISTIILMVFSTLIFSLIGITCGLVGSIILSGLKGRGHNIGPTYLSGFGAHHPGGIILSDEECKENRFKHENLRHQFFRKALDET